MRLGRILFAIFVMSLCIGCSDSTEPDIDDFRLTLDVVDAQGDPVENLEVRLHVHIPEIDADFGSPPFSGAKPATAIDFIAPVTARVRMTIYDLVGEQLRLLVDGAHSAGMHQITFNGCDDQGNYLLGTAILRCEMIAHDLTTDEILYRHSEWMALYTGIDYQQRPILGFTNAEGGLTTNNNLLMPFLHELPDLQRQNENGETVGSFTISDVVTITLTDTLTSLQQSFDMRIEQGINRHQLEWTSPTLQIDSPQHLLPTASPTDICGKAGDDPIPVEWLLHPCYPNPFN